MTHEVKMDWLMDETVRRGADVSLARMTVPVGVLSECHRHSNCSETLHLLQGRTRQRVGDDWLEMEAGETCFIPAGDAHQTENVGVTDAVLMVCYGAGRRIYERVG